MEGLDVRFATYRGRRVLLTGHTGFKGSWMALWLQELGARVTGIALPPESDPNHWQLLRLNLDSRMVDVRDAGALREAVQEAFISAFRARAQFHADSRISTWLHRIAVNAALSRLRSRRRRPEDPIDELLPRFNADGHHAEQLTAWTPDRPAGPASGSRTLFGYYRVPNTPAAVASLVKPEERPPK